jgi:MFS family permease
MPPTYSLVGDYFPGSAQRARAMAVYLLANPVSSLVSFVLGGWLNEQYGWRMTFFIMGVPGLLLAVLVKVTVKEPRTLVHDGASVARPAVPRLAHVLATLWRQQSSRHLIVAFILLWTIGSGLGPWYAAFMIRSHGMGTAELGVWLGGIFGIGGMVGTLLGGYVTGRWFADNERGQMRASAWVVAATVPCFVLFLLLPHKHQALIALIPLVVLSGFFLGPGFALMQRLVPDDMRATTLAVVMLLANLIGMGLGPQIVGILSDALRPALGADSLRYAMLAMATLGLWAAWHFRQVAHTVTDDLIQRRGA